MDAVIICCGDPRYGNGSYLEALEIVICLAQVKDVKNLGRLRLFGGILPILVPDCEAVFINQLDTMKHFGVKKCVILEHEDCHYAKWLLDFRKIPYSIEAERLLHLETIRRFRKMFLRILPDAELVVYCQTGSELEPISAN